MRGNKKINNIFSTWNDVENAIEKEIIWLKNKVPIMPQSYIKYNPDFLQCDDCILRKIAILIVSGKVRACEINSKNKTDLWN